MESESLKIRKLWEWQEKNRFESEYGSLFILDFYKSLDITYFFMYAYNRGEHIPKRNPVRWEDK